MAHDVFISHSHKDKPLADSVCAALEASKVRCWIAPRDITPGSSWGEAIINALNSCRVMVLVFSPDSNASPQVAREVERAVNRGIPIIPMRIADFSPTGAMEYFLSVPHWLDAMTPPIEQHIVKLTMVVKSLLKTDDAANDSYDDGPRGEQQESKGSADKSKRSSDNPGRTGSPEVEEPASSTAARDADASRDMSEEELVVSDSERTPVRTRLRTVSELKAGYESLRRDSLIYDAKRLAPDALKTAELFAEKASTYAGKNHDLATRNYKRAIHGAESALLTAVSSRIEELESFVADCSSFFRSGEKSREAKQEAIQAIAKKHVVSTKAANILIKQAWKITRSPLEPVLPVEVAEAVFETVSSGLGLSRTQKLVVQKDNKRNWPYVVFGLFALFMIAALVLTLFGVFSDASMAIAYIPIFAALAILGGALLFTPVRVASRRPERKRELWITLTSVGFLASMLTLGPFLAVSALLMEEAGYGETRSSNDVMAAGILYSGFAISAIAWPLWIFVLWKGNRAGTARTSFERLYARLYRGSIIELLTVVPVHLLVRKRDECSAGGFSAAAIVIGVLVALCSLGPGMLILIAKQKRNYMIELEVERMDSTWSRGWLILGVYALALIVAVFVVPESLLIAFFIASFAATATVLVLLRKQLW